MSRLRLWVVSTINLVALFYALPSLAVTLEGTTFCGNTRMEGAIVEATSLATGLVTDTSATNFNGQYDLELEPGPYDLLVTPPAGSECTSQLIQSKQVTGPETYDILLVIPGGPPPTFTVQGTVLVNGLPLVGAEVRLQGPDFRSTTTDSLGHYSAEVVAGNYDLRLEAYDNNGTRPDGMNCNRFVNVQSSATQDFSIELIPIEGIVFGTPSLLPAVGVNVTAYSYANGCSSWDSGTTDNAGTYGGFVFPSAPVNAQSAGIQNALETSGASGESPASGVMSLDIYAAELTSFVVPGRITNHLGEGLANVHVRADTNSGQVFATTDTNGDFAFETVAGTYNMTIEMSDGNTLLPNNLNCNGQVALDAATELNFVIPTAEASGSVIAQPSETPASGVSVTVYSNVALAGFSLGCSGTSYAQTDTSGEFGPVPVLAGNIYFNSAPQGQTLSDANSNTTAMAGELVTTLLNPQELANFQVTGQVTGRGGRPLGGTLYFQGPVSIPAGLDAEGEYSTTLAPAGYFLQLFGGTSDIETGPPEVNCNGFVNFEAATTYNLTLPIAKVTGRVTNSAGIPIAGVSVYVNSGAPASALNCNANQWATSDSDGRYTLAVMIGYANFTFDPPSGSGYQSASVSTNPTGDLSQQVVLQLPDVVPPVITVGPLVIHHSDTSVSVQWSTNESTDARLEYAAGATLTDPTVLTRATFSTNHLFTLTGLLPATNYIFVASGLDGGGNAVASNPVTFTTMSDPDTTAPLITDGPTAVFVSPTLIRVRWTTNEPSNSVVDVGADGSHVKTVTQAAFVLEHDVVINGLSPTTLYAIEVASTDPDNNTSAPHDPLLVRTPAVVDTTPPVVSNLRAECTTDTAISVCWDTQEAATGAVTYINQSNGSAATVTSTALTTSRCIGLSGLSPLTSYSISVASADGGGNVGNGGPFVHETLSNAEGGSPIVSQLFAAAVGTTGARVTWVTDRPASSLVRYGTGAEDLPNTAGNVAASETSHTVILSGLPLGQTTWVRVVSTNQCQQTTTSEAVQVTDIDECVTGTAGCDDNAICTHTTGLTTCECGAGFTGNGTKCCAICTGGQERATDCGEDPYYGCDFRPTIVPQSFEVNAGSAAGTPIGQVLAADADPGDGLTYSVTGGNIGNAVRVEANTGILRVETPAEIDQRVGTSFVVFVRVTDAIGLSASAEVTVDVKAAAGPCAQSPCVHGTCVPDGDVATCDCTGSGFTGSTCATDVNECTTANGGCQDLCNNLEGGFECACSGGGVLASDGSTCLAEGTCVEVISCEESTTALVFFGVIADEANEPVGSIRCVHEIDGQVTCDTHPDGTIAISPTLWCSNGGE